jgi:hypothetical protein
MSPIVDQTIRCINGENTLLKRVFRVPNPRRAVTTGYFNKKFIIGFFLLLIFRNSFNRFT